MAQFIEKDAPVRDDARVALIERSLIVLLVLGLFVGVLAIIRPFTTAILFGASLATATWPARQYLVRRGLSHGAAAIILLLSSLLLIALPVIAIAPNIAEQLVEVSQRAQSYFTSSPEAPAWLAGTPIVGTRLNSAWQQVVQAQGNIRTLSAPYAAEIQQALLVAARALAESVVQLILSLVVATMFWANGDALMTFLHNALHRLGGAAADDTLTVAGSAIRGVAYGVVGTALIQAVLLAIGLAVAGVPAAPVLGFVALLLAISQIGAPLLIVLWGGAAWWLFSTDQPIWGGFMIGWGVLVSMIDNFIKPWLIGFGLQMPLSLTILGVFGGFTAFGFLGLFIGPTLMAIFFTLVQAWNRADLETDTAMAGRVPR